MSFQPSPSDGPDAPQTKVHYGAGDGSPVHTQEKPPTPLSTPAPAGGENALKSLSIRRSCTKIPSRSVSDSDFKDSGNDCPKMRSMLIRPDFDGQKSYTKVPAKRWNICPSASGTSPSFFPF
jgi:hypothetical protein